VIRSVSFRESKRYFPVHFRQFGPEYEWVETLTPTEVTKLGGFPYRLLGCLILFSTYHMFECVGFCGDFQSWIVALKSEGLEQRRILGGSVGRKQRHYGGALPLCLFENRVLPKSAGFSYSLMIITAYPMATHLGTPHLWHHVASILRSTKSLQHCSRSANQRRRFGHGMERFLDVKSQKHGMTHGEGPAEKTFKIL